MYYAELKWLLVATFNSAALKLAKLKQSLSSLKFYVDCLAALYRDLIGLSGVGYKRLYWSYQTANKEINVTNLGKKNIKKFR